MNPEIKTRWVAALRSGKYQQGNGALRSNITGSDKFCCLGVLCEIAVADGVIDRRPPHRDTNHNYTYGPNADDSLLPHDLLEWSGLADTDGPVDLTEDEEEDWGMSGSYTLAEANDTGVDFTTIADLIEEKL